MSKAALKNAQTFYWNKIKILPADLAVECLSEIQNAFQEFDLGKLSLGQADSKCDLAVSNAISRLNGRC